MSTSLIVNMLNDDCVGDSRNALAFIEAYRRQKGTCGDKQHPLPCTVLYLRQDIGTQRNRAAAASASARMCVLLFLIVYLDSAVHMDLAQVPALVLHELQKDGPAHFPQVTGDNLVIPCFIDLEILQVLFYGVERGRRPARLRLPCS